MVSDWLYFIVRVDMWSTVSKPLVSDFSECVSENIFEIGEYLAKLQAREWLSHALYPPGQHTY